MDIENYTNPYNFIYTKDLDTNKKFCSCGRHCHKIYNKCIFCLKLDLFFVKNSKLYRLNNGIHIYCGKVHN